MATRAEAKETYQYSSDLVYKALLSVLTKDNGFSVKSSDDRTKIIEAKTGASMTNFIGEALTVKIVANSADSCDVMVASELIVPALTDYGKNKKNVAKVFDLLSVAVAQNQTADEPVYVLDGGNKDCLYVYEDRVVISRKGVTNALIMGVKGDKTIYYSDITSVQYKKPGMTGGYIQFSIPGGNESRGGVLSAINDENSVPLKSDPAVIKKANEVVDYINKRIREEKTGAKAAPTVVQQVSAADELKKFKELLDMGVITQEEFDAKKKQLLGL